MDEALNLPIVNDRGQVMMADMAAHECFGKMVTKLELPPPKRFRDRIILGQFLRMLTRAEAEHLQSYIDTTNEGIE